MRFSSVVLLSGLLVLGEVGAARAQSSEDLASGRQLFAEALEDEDHHRYAAALEKYQRVARIKETPAVRYRMGNTLEAMGKPMQAIDAYRAVIALGGPGDTKIVHASRSRIDELEPKVAHLTIRVRPPTRDAEARVDDVPIPSGALEDTRLDPGTHVIVVTAPGAADARATVTLSEGGRAEIPLILEPKALPPPPPPPPPPPAPPTSARPIAIGAAALGGVLVASGITVALLRSAAIADLNESCPAGRCPASRESELRATRDRAVVEGPVAVTLLGHGVVALGAGIYLWLRAR
jgi:hypothetical protein